MSYCKNCGTNIGESKFCSNCGQPSAETTITTATPTTSPTATSNVFSAYYPELCAYSSNATKMFVFGILSLIFCMGIGIIFEIINIVISVKIKKPFEHGDKLTNPVEIAMYNTARSRHKAGAIMSSIALVITGILLFILFMTSMIYIQTK